VGGIDSTSSISSAVTIVSGASCPLSGIDCAAFDGTVAAYVDFGTPVPDIASPDSFPWTIEGWAYFNSFTGDPFVYALNHHNPITMQDDMRLVVAAAASNSKLVLSWNDGTIHSVVDSTALSTGTWYYFVARFDGTNYKISHNGTSGGSATGNPIGVPAASDVLRLASSDSGTKSGFNGRLSMVSWYKGVALSDSEVTAHYNSGSGRECCPFK